MAKKIYTAFYKFIVEQKSFSLFRGIDTFQMDAFRPAAFAYYYAESEEEVAKQVLAEKKLQEYPLGTKIRSLFIGENYHGWAKIVTKGMVKVEECSDHTIKDLARGLSSAAFLEYCLDHSAGKVVVKV